MKGQENSSEGGSYERTQLTLMLRAFDRLWVFVGVIAVLAIGLANLALPSRDWLTFGAFMTCIYGACWYFNRRRAIARFGDRAMSKEKPPKA